MKALLYTLTFTLLYQTNFAQNSKKTFLAYTTHQKKIGFVDINGRLIIPIEFDDTRQFSEGLIAVNKGAQEIEYIKKGGKWGFWNKKGKEVIPLKYEDAKSFEEGLAAVKLNGKYGFINKKDKVVIDFRFDNVKSFSEGLAAVKVGKKWGFIDKKGRWQIKPTHDRVASFQHQLAKVFYKDSKYYYTGEYGKYGLINTQGKLVLDTIYEQIHPFKENFARIERNSKTGFINTQGKIVIPIQYNSADDFSEGLAAVAKYIITNPTPKTRYTSQQIDSIKNTLKKRFQSTSKDSTELDKLFKDERFIEFLQNKRMTLPKKLKYGYINQKGEVVIAYQFKYAQPFKNGLATIQFREIPGSYSVFTDNQGNRVPLTPPHPNDHYNAVNKEGQLLTIKDKPITINQKTFFIRDNKVGTGIYNQQQQQTVLAPGKYQEIEHVGNGFFVGKSVKSSNKVLFTLTREIASDSNFLAISYSQNDRFTVSYITQRKGYRLITKSGIMDAQGQWILTPTYDHIGKFYEIK